MSQCELNLKPSFDRCDHGGAFYTHAYVPGGGYCDLCDTLLWQDAPPTFNEPAELGYVTANWAWHFRDGKPWTTKEAGVLLARQDAAGVMGGRTSP